MSDQRTQWNNLPGKAYRELVGRDAEVSDIMAALRDPAGKWIVAIDGMEGIGKTALAREVADRCLNECLFDAVVWESAPREEFAGGERRKGTGTLTFETMLDVIGRQLGALDVPRLKGAEKEGRVQALLRSQRVLVVLDNLETAKEPQNEIARRLQPLLDPSKALLTSRDRFKGDLYAIHLTGLDEEDALRFIHQEVEEKGIERVTAAKASDLRQIARATGGSPLALKLAISQLGHLPLDTVLSQLRDVWADDYPRFYRAIFFPCWRLLSEEGKKLLISMAHFASGVGGTYEAVKVTSDLADDMLTRSIDELWRLSFLEVSESPSLKQVRYYLHPLTQYFVLSDIVEQWQRIYEKAQHRFIERFLDFVQQYHSDFNALDMELSNILQGLDLCVEQENWSLLAEFTRVLNDFWVKRGYWNVCVKYNRILLGTNALPEGSERARILDHLTTVEEARGNYAEARRLYRQQLQIYSQVQTADTSSVTAALRQLVRLATLQGDYDEAQQFLEHQLGIVRGQQSAKDQVDVMRELAVVHQKRNDLDRAELLCQQSLEIAQRISYTVGRVDVLRQ